KDKIEELENKSWLEKLGEGFLAIAIPPLGLTLVGGKHLAEGITKDNIREKEQECEDTLREAKRKLQGFCRDYQERAQAVHRYAQNYIQGIQKCYSMLIQSLNELLDPPPFEKSDDSDGE